MGGGDFGEKYVRKGKECRKASDQGRGGELIKRSEFRHECGLDIR